jgi:hypothetical protein
VQVSISYKVIDSPLSDLGQHRFLSASYDSISGLEFRLALHCHLHSGNMMLRSTSAAKATAPWSSIIVGPGRLIDIFCVVKIFNSFGRIVDFIAVILLVALVALVRFILFGSGHFKSRIELLDVCHIILRVI